MKKNKLFAGAMGLVMLGAMVLPVHAEDMTVTYREPNSYTVSIPSEVTLSSTQETSNKIEVKDVNLEPNKGIKIKISQGVDENGIIELSRKDDEDTKAISTISKTSGGQGIALNTDFATFTDNGEQELFYSAIEAQNGGDVKAGTYSGTLTFTVTAPAKN